MIIYKGCCLGLNITPQWLLIRTFINEGHFLIIMGDRLIPTLAACLGVSAAALLTLYAGFVQNDRESQDHPTYELQEQGYQWQIGEKEALEGMLADVKTTSDGGHYCFVKEVGRVGYEDVSAGSTFDHPTSYSEGDITVVLSYDSVEDTFSLTQVIPDGINRRKTTVTYNGKGDLSLTTQSVSSSHVSGSSHGQSTAHSSGSDPQREFNYIQGLHAFTSDGLGQRESCSSVAERLSVHL